MAGDPDAHRLRGLEQRPESHLVVMIFNIYLVRLQERQKIYFGSKSGEFVSDLIIISIFCPSLGKTTKLTQLRGPYPNDIKGWSLL